MVREVLLLCGIITGQLGLTCKIMTMKNIIIFILLLCSIQMSAQKINSLTQNLSLSNNNINISNGSGVSLDILQSSNTVIRQSPTLTLKNSTQDVLTINGNGVNILNAGTDNTATVIYGKDPGNGAVVEITDLAAFSGASNRLYQAATYSNITAINYPLLTVGDRIKVMDTGAEYLVQATSVPEFVTDEHAVITVGSNYAVLQPQNGEINATWLGLDESLGDATSEIQDAYAYAAALNVGLIADLGTYKVNNANLNGATYAPPYVDLKGATFIPVDESFTDYIIRVYNCYDVKNFNVDASSIDTVYDQGTKFLQIAADGINPLNVKNVNVTGLAWTTNVNGVGNHQNLLVSNNNGNLRTQNNITIEDCYLKDADYAAINIPINQNSTTIVKNVRIENYKQRSITTNGGAKYYVYPPTIGQDTITVDFQPIEGASFYINPENASGTGNTHARYIITDYAKIGNFYRITLDRGLDAAVASNDIVCTVSGSLIMDNLHVTVDSTAIDFTIQGGGVIDPINMIIENCILKNSRFEGYGYLGVGLKFDYYRNLVIENTVINNVNPSALGLPIQAQYATNIANVLEDPQFISTINNSYIGGRLGRDAFTNYTNNTTLEGASDTQLYLYNTNLDSSRHYLTNVEFRNAETTCIYNSATGSTFDITNCTVTTDNPAIGQETTDAFFLSVGTYAGQHRINGLTKPDYMRTYSLSADNSIALTNFGDEVYIRDNAPFISSSTRWAHGARRIFRADQALNPGNYRAGDVMINDHYDSVDDIVEWIHDGTTWQPQYNSNAGSNKVYRAATYADIVVANLPAIALGDRIKVEDTGAEYLVQAAAVPGYTTDGIAVIQIEGKFAALQPTGNEYKIEYFGLNLDGITDDQTELENAIKYAAVVNGKVLNLGNNSIAVSAQTLITTTLTKPFIIKGDDATIVETGSVELQYMLYLSDTGGQDVELSGVTFDCNEYFSQGVRFDGTGASKVYLEEVHIIDAKWTVGTQTGAVGFIFVGSFDVIKAESCTTKDIGRLASLNTPGSNGSNSFAISQGVAGFPKKIYINNCTFDNVYTEDTGASVNNSDCDHISVVGTTYKRSQHGKDYPVNTQVYVTNSTFINAQGRSMKFQIPSVEINGCTFIHNARYKIDGGLNDISFQAGGGYVNNCTWLLESYNDGGDNTSPFQANDDHNFVSAVANVGFEYYRSTTVTNCTVENTMDTLDVGIIPRAFIQFASSPGETSRDLDIRNIRLYGVHNSLLKMSFGAGINSTITIDNVTIDSLEDLTTDGNLGDGGLVSFNGTNDAVNIQVTRAKYLGVSEPKVYSNLGGASSFGAITTGMDNYGFLRSKPRASNENPNSTILNTALGDVANNRNSGTFEIRGVTLADDETWTVPYDGQAYRFTGFMNVISKKTDANFNVQLALGFSTITGTNVGANVSLGTSNPDIDGDLNIWLSGGLLYMKNRSGGVLDVTTAYFGNN